MKEFYSQFMTKTDLVFDVGANVGDKATIFSELADKVIAIEPQAETFAALRDRFVNTNVTPVNKAVGDYEGVAKILHPADLTTIASLSNRFIEGVRKTRRFGPASIWDEAEEVGMTTLDILIEQFGVPAFIKIDVEGFEPEVIRGLSQLIPLSFEFTPELLYMVDEVFDHLRTLGSFETNYGLLNDYAKLELSDWVSAETMQKELKKYESSNCIMGDVYVRKIRTLD
jgi:FkbM family methyltransferase